MASLWIGAWNLEDGWGTPDERLANLSAQGIEPVVQFYYWGDDLTPECLANGCFSATHGTYKDQAGWSVLATTLTEHLRATLGGHPCIIVLETEFNKAQVAHDDALDLLLAEKARELHAGYPDSKVALGLGNWNRAAWSTWDDAAQASDMIGIQGLRSTGRTGMDGVAQDLVAAAADAHALFGKPVLVDDLALSSYPDAAEAQAQALQSVAASLPRLKDEGVVGIVYRSWSDTPTRSTADTFGQAELHWGLVEYDGAAKPAAAVWTQAIGTERTDPA